VNKRSKERTMMLDLSKPVGYVYTCPICAKEFMIRLSKPITEPLKQIFCPKCKSILGSTGIPPQYAMQTEFVGREPIPLENLNENLEVD
jgi:DNA-directed RNA polymerase subunit RPC12/RpoP